MARPAVPGLVRMDALAADLPNALLAGFRAGVEVELPNGHGVPRTLAVGMGGSGIAVDLVRGVFDAESRVALTVVRSGDLPRAVDSAARVVLVSYSGETWETLRAYAAAGRAGAARVVLTSGGALAERAEEDGVPVLHIPPGMPARAAVGHLVGGFLGLLDPAFPESNEARVARIAEHLRGEIGRYARAGGPAEALADAVGDRLPFVYADSGFLAVARRWANQIEENAKRLAVYDELPELFHNAIVGWDSVLRAEASRAAVLLLEWSEAAPPIRKGTRHLERLLATRGVTATRVPLPSDDRLEAVLQGVALGDQLSLRLAEHRKVDPTAIEAIERLRSALGRGGVPDR